MAQHPSKMHAAMNMFMCCLLRNHKYVSPKHFKSLRTFRRAGFRKSRAKWNKVNGHIYSDLFSPFYSRREWNLFQLPDLVPNPGPERLPWYSGRGDIKFACVCAPVAPLPVRFVPQSAFEDLVGENNAPKQRVFQDSSKQVQRERKVHNIWYTYLPSRESSELSAVCVWKGMNNPCKY